ncbi:hypothetical protein LMH87_005860 [Akanthomyces muscarius]|uniref:DUF7136 domain-containing protein n=1 Tax=Akanthomyces muscarius TaxID=2231603 RepID=A0A9W8QMR7_AKAMU|nr:hypothetical protein LMH87_005860 [Akanthomyces muscarius]KAJ4164175.1 hypothetical protein LMH87_005860 [Akanthomyces muscarius]
MKLSLLGLGFAASSAIAAATGNAEVDVIFPRNDTFAPTPLMPIVFAVQNPAVAQQLNLRLNYRVIPYGRPNATTDYERVRLNALPNNDTTFYAHDFVSDIFNKEGTWEFFWQLRWNNCTSTKDEYGMHFSRDTQEPVNSFVFTTHNDGSKPDLVAIGSDDKCGNTQGIGFEVQDVLDVPPPKNADLLSSCAHVAVPAPTPTPCSASVPSEAAESISSRITQAACLAATPVVSCPSQENASGRAASNMAVVALSLGSALYAYIF